MSEFRTNLIKWAGSKTSIANKIVPFLDFERTYIEPFCGSAAFFFMNDVQNAYLNDNNPNLISFYKHTSSKPKQVWEIYNSLKVSEENYYKIRATYNELDFSLKKSAYFLYLNHYCFNGLYRTNRSGEFNTPFGAKSFEKTKHKIDYDAYLQYSRRLRLTELHSLDFEAFLKQIKPTDACIYMDPPYFTNDKRVFSEYGAKPFGLDDLHRLHDVAIKLAKNNNKVVISYRDCSEFRDLFSEHIEKKIMVQRNVGGFAGRRKRDKEIIAIIE